MKVRRVGMLAQLADEEFLSAAAKGAGLCLNNAERLFDEAQSARQAEAMRGSLILRTFAEEEASKALILVDAVRCPPSEREMRSRQLSKFSNHLSRLIYSEVCSYRSMDFRELKGMIEGLREEYFLDGPAGFDWIFRNRLLQERESALYVDYVEADDGQRWDAPNEALVKMLTLGGLVAPHSLIMARQLNGVGIFSDAGMRVVADVWRGSTPPSEMSRGDLRRLNRLMLEGLGAAGLCRESKSRDLAAVQDEWPFPLWQLDTRLVPVKFDDLQAAQETLTTRYPGEW